MSAKVWDELSWIGEEITIGKVVLKVSGKIVRCAAIDVDPLSGATDKPVLKSLNKYVGHACFGVLADVICGGQITIGDEMSVNEGSCSKSKRAHGVDR